MAEKYINPHTDFDRDIVNAIRTAERRNMRKDEQKVRKRQKKR